MSFRTSGWIYIVFGCFFVIVAAVEMRTREVRSLQIASRFCWAAGLLLVGVSNLSKQSWREPATALEWAGTALICLAAVLAIANWRTKRPSGPTRAN